MKIKYTIITLFIFFYIKTNPNSITSTNLKINQPINSLILYTEILKSDIIYPDIVFAQAILETGEFTSEIFHLNRNLFGMKFPRIRKTTSLGKSKEGYAIYESWNHSVDDYQLWQKSNVNPSKIKNKNDYYKLLSKVYAEDKQYVSKLKKILITHQKVLY